MKSIFSKVWIPVCHESELPEPDRFRTTTIAGVPILVVRDNEGEIHALANTSERRPSGKIEKEVGFLDVPDYLHCDVKFGGFVWVTLNDNPPTVEEWVDGSFDCMKESLNAEPLDLFIRMCIPLLLCRHVLTCPRFISETGIWVLLKQLALQKWE